MEKIPDMDGIEFEAGDLVTRDGTDVQRVLIPDDGFGNIRVQCVKAPKSGWCKVGEVEDNLASRYMYAGKVIEN